MNPPNFAYVTWATVPDLTIEHFHRYREKVLNPKALDDSIKVTKLDPVEGFPCVLTRTATPHMYARRSVITTHYTSSKESERPFESLNSSWDNQRLLQTYKREIEDDVVAFMHLNYIKMWIDPENPKVCNWVSVFCFDLKGMLANDDTKEIFEKGFNDHAASLINTIKILGH